MSAARHCRWCGAAFERSKNGRHPKVCPACARVRKAAYVRLYHKHGGGVTPAMLDEETALALDAVHMVTGRTNGWDRPPRRAAVSADGWRGRPVAGPSSRLARGGGRSFKS